MLSHLLSGHNPDSLLQAAISQWLDPSATPLSTSPASDLVSHPDLVIIPADPASSDSIGIEEIRQLARSLQLLPTVAPTKLAVIHQAHRLTLTAQNALLKTLEEPPSRTQIVLTSTKPHSLLPTILSRVVHTKITTNSHQIAPNLETSKLRNLETILSLPPTLRLPQTPIVAATRDSAREFLISALHYFHHQLVADDKYPMTNNQILTSIRLLTQSLRYLDANTHPQLTLDHLFLNLPCTGNSSPKPV